MMHQCAAQTVSRFISGAGHLAANQLNGDIQRRYNLSEEAEGETQRWPAENHGRGTAAVHDGLALAVTRCSFSYTSTQFNKVDHILLAGGCGGINGLDEVVANRTQVGTMIANLFLNMTSRTASNQGSC